MPITAQFSDAVEPISDTDAELATNQHLYGVISGCAITYDAADLTYDVAAGVILHNGVSVTVAAQPNASLLVADATNPRWASIYLDSSGIEGVVHGTAAAVPSKPETGDNVLLAMVLIEAAQTIANNIAVKLDKRVMTHVPASVTYKYKTAQQTFTTTTSTTITATSGNFAFAVDANTAYRFHQELNIGGVGTQNSGGVKLEWTGPASPTRIIIQGLYPAYIAQTADAGTDNEYPFQSYIDVDNSVTSFGAYLQSNAAPTPAAGSATGVRTGRYVFDILFVNGANAGTVTFQMAQNTAAGTSSIEHGFVYAQRLNAE